MSQLTICLLISVLTIASYIWNKFSLATTALISLLLFTISGCIDVDMALGYFSNPSGLMIIAMSIVAAGFNRTQFVKKFAQSISRMAKGSLTKVMAGYVLAAVVLSQFVQAPFVVFSILYPLLASTAEDMNISASKVMFSLGVTSIATCSALPLGAGATVAAELNGYLQANGYTDFVVAITDPMKSRLPLLIVCCLYCIFIAPKFAPDKPVVATENKDNTNFKNVMENKALKPFQEKAAFIIFFATTLGLIFCDSIRLAPWQVCMIGALLMVVCGVLSTKEATNAMPIWVYLMFVGSLSMAGALSNTGAGELIGNTIASVTSGLQSNVLIYLIFFALPFLITQVMVNRTVMLIFTPIAIQTCMSMGVNPVGVIITVQAACLTAFMTPMATSAVPYFMGVGGYDLKCMLKQSVLPAFLFSAVTIVWNAIVFPLF